MALGISAAISAAMVVAMAAALLRVATIAATFAATILVAMYEQKLGIESRSIQYFAIILGISKAIAAMPSAQRHKKQSCFCLVF